MHLLHHFYCLTVTSPTSFGSACTVAGLVLNQEAADVVVEARPKETPAKNAVLTPELLESILNALPL